MHFPTATSITTTQLKQIHGCAMGSLVHPIVANLCLEAIEDHTLLKLWVPYVDDVFSIIKNMHYPLSIIY